MHGTAVTCSWDIPDLDRLGEHLLVSFPVRRLPAAQVVWLNHRWWLAHGWDTSLDPVRTEVEKWLLGTFAVVACASDEAEANSRLRADRYGGSGGTHHGGSGRCGIHGPLNAKGIGRTPLVPSALTDHHCDGRLSMVEAIREAVSAEIASLELPYGAVPVLAIIDCGGAAEEGEAIIVRPNFVRPAHFERSIFFGSSGTSGSDQHLDALRTRSAIASASSETSTFCFPGLIPMFERFAVQIGAAHAHRLWQGRFLTSNVSTTGALVDFGSFRSVPSWRRFFGDPEEQFGAEDRYLELAWRSIAASFRKYSPTRNGPPGPADLSRLKSGVVQGFETAVATALGLESLGPTPAERIVKLLRGYFVHQQACIVQVAERRNWRLPWLHDILGDTERAADDSFRAEARLIREIDIAAAEASPIHGRIGNPIRLLRAALSRWTCPRQQLHYEWSRVEFRRVAAAMRRSPERRREIVGGAIGSLLSSLPRNWGPLPLSFELKGQRHDGVSTILYGHDHITDRPAAMVRGTRWRTRIRLFDHWLDEAGSPLETEIAPPGWFLMACDHDAIERGFCARLGSNEVRFPPAGFRYPPVREDVAVQTS